MWLAEEASFYIAWSMALATLAHTWAMLFGFVDKRPSALAARDPSLSWLTEVKIGTPEIYAALMRATADNIQAMERKSPVT